MKTKILKGFFHVNMSDEFKIIKANSMSEAIFKFVGKTKQKYLTKISETNEYTTFHLNIPHSECSDFFIPVDEIITARLFTYYD